MNCSISASRAESLVLMYCPPKRNICSTCDNIILASEKAVKGFLEDFFVWGVQVMISLLKHKNHIRTVYGVNVVLQVFVKMRLSNFYPFYKLKRPRFNLCVRIIFSIVNSSKYLIPIIIGLNLSQ